eukprot:TRINITY_DN18661_c0_g4_i1.p2 TRINITY_DN18661_c0_g4~~TRINITY_DN18661_c0_g4_i1.p2  ORF type:complete len:413 (+),score=81.09 TRINITY_DN18661_c0_g4_i1:58-1239(+)
MALDDAAAGNASEVPRVGLFVQRWYPRRRYETVFGMALRAALASPLASFLPYFEVHVVAHRALPLQPLRRAWRRALPQEVPLEVHPIDTFNPHVGADRSPFHQGTYMAQVHEALAVCRSRRLTHLLNTDDDVLFTPWALLSMLAAAAKLERASRCAVLSPLLSTGVPTVEMFMASFLAAEDQERLRRCFAGSTIEHFDWDWDYRSLHPLPDPWDAAQFYEAVERLPHDFRGVHPVRRNRSCMTLASELALRSLRRGAGVPAATVGSLPPTLGDVVVPQRAFPYFCNSAWLARSDDYARILRSDHLFRDHCDEVPMSLWMRREKRRLCVVPGALALHPAYNGHPAAARLELRSFNEMVAYMKAWYPAAYAEVQAAEAEDAEADDVSPSSSEERG